jgi:outer membrane immunogenic protein
MMKFVAIVVTALTTAASAMAADLPAPLYTKAPAYVDQGYNWTGFYLGINLGYSWGRSHDTSTFSDGYGTGLYTSTGSSNLDGILGGGQAGYNWQTQSWVWGLEADIQATGEKGGRGFTCPTGTCTPSTFFVGALVFPIPGPAVAENMNQTIDWFGTVRGRVGFLATPKILFYGTGGLAYGAVNSNLNLATPTGALNRFSATDTKVGYAIGGGIEGVLSGNWTAKLEYLYVDLGTVSGTYGTNITAAGGAPLVTSYSSRITDNVLRFGVNYKLN